MKSNFVIFRHRFTELEYNNNNNYYNNNQQYYVGPMCSNGFDINLAAQKSSVDPRYGIYWPIGYYTKIEMGGDYEKLFNVPGEKVDGGFDNGYLNKPLAEALLENGVFDMNLGNLDRSKPEIVTSPSEPTTSFPLATAS